MLKIVYYDIGIIFTPFNNIFSSLLHLSRELTKLFAERGRNMPETPPTTDILVKTNQGIQKLNIFVRHGVANAAVKI